MAGIDWVARVSSGARKSAGRSLQMEIQTERDFKMP